MITWFEGFEAVPEKTSFYRGAYSSYKRSINYGGSYYFYHGLNGWKSSDTDKISPKELFVSEGAQQDNYFSYPNCEYGTHFLVTQKNLSRDIPEIKNDIFTLGMMVCSGGANSSYIYITNMDETQVQLRLKLNEDKTAILLSGEMFSEEIVVHTFNSAIENWTWINLEVQMNLSSAGWLKIRVNNKLSYNEERDFSVFDLHAFQFGPGETSLYKCLDNIYFSTGDDTFFGQIIVKKAQGVLTTSQNYISTNDNIESDLTDIVQYYNTRQGAETKVTPTNFGAKHIKKYTKPTDETFAGYVVTTRFRDTTIEGDQGLSVYVGSNETDLANNRTITGVFDYNVYNEIIDETELNSTSSEFLIGFGTKE